MKPFVQEQKPTCSLHWWAIAGVAGAFFIWSFDLVPRLKDPASGHVANGDASRSQLTTEADLNDEWLNGLTDEQPDPTSDADADRNVIARDSASTAHDTQTVSDDELMLSEPSLDEIDEAIADTSITTASYSPESETVASRNDDPGSQVLPADVAEQLRLADAALSEDRVLDAHAALSAMYWKHPEFRSLLQDRIDETAGTIFTSNARHFAEPHFVEFGETLDSIAKQYEVPWQYLSMLNRIQPQQLQAGQKLKVVRGPFAAVVDLSDFCLTVHAHGWYIHRYRIGIGRDQRTPVGEFTVQNKLENPTWYGPEGIVVDADDPQNPLGEYWLGLGDHIGIHGTIDPDSIGKAASRGCLHLADDDIAEVFALLSTGSKVLIRK